MDQSTQRLIDEIKKLRGLLSNDGEYTIVRQDRKDLDIGDIMLVGSVMERIDDCVMEIEGGE